jgi:NAD(P)-dependent dehydrogenase (short-subunit alcohol dehydrogenase family)
MGVPIAIGGDKPGFPTPPQQGRRSGKGQPATLPAFPASHAEIRRFGWEHCRRVFGRIIEFEPSIAVLPFTNMSGDRAKEDFADGLVEETIPWSAVSAGICFWPSDESRWVTGGTVTVDGGYLAI